VHVHNEEAAALAAASEAQLTGQLAVCGGSCGPGNTHLVQGLYDAHRSGAPVLAIASHIPSTQIGTNYFQETHRDEVLKLAEKVHGPIGHSLGGKEWIQYDNPYDVGMSGLLGYGACYQATHESDLLILLGTDFPYDTFLPQARTVQIDRDAANLGRCTRLDLGVEGDVGATLRAVLPLVEAKSDRAFLDRMLRKHAAKLEKVVSAYTANAEKLPPVHPEYVAALLDETMDDDAIVTVDTGMGNVWAARSVTPTGRRRIIGSFRHATMANALPHAIRAAYAEPGRQVVSMSGDGGLTMLLGELLTVAEHNLPVKVVAFNNGSLGMIRLEMMVSGYPSFQTDHGVADLAGVASACGIPSVAVVDPADLPKAVRTALPQRRPAPSRRAHRPERAVHPAAHHRQPGTRLRPGRHPHRATAASAR
jgi:pyruvate dehydrogenase (quinone)